MRNFQIKSVGQFMTMLLKGDCFDDYYFEGAEIVTFNTFTLDGHIHRDFYDSAEADAEIEDFSKWSDIKGFCFDIIKGKRLPISFNIVLHAPDIVKNEILEGASNFSKEDIKALVVNIRYNQDGLKIISGTSMATFFIDKSVEGLWDEKLSRILFSYGVEEI